MSESLSMKEILRLTASDGCPASHQEQHPDSHDEHGRPLFEVADVEDPRIERIREYCDREITEAVKHSMPGVPTHKLTGVAARCRHLIVHLREVLRIIDSGGDDA